MLAILGGQKLSGQLRSAKYIFGYTLSVGFFGYTLIKRQLMF